MTVQIDHASVRTSVEVTAAPKRAFAVFAEDIDRWWLRGHHLQEGELARVAVEPFEGGRLFEEVTSGATCTWGRVLTWDPPRTFAFSWLIGPDWGVPAPDAPGSRVTVTFTPTADGTHVELVHDRLDAHGEGWTAERDAVGSDGGWPSLLAGFAAAV